MRRIAIASHKRLGFFRRNFLHFLNLQKQRFASRFASLRSRTSPADRSTLRLDPPPPLTARSFQATRAARVAPKLTRRSAHGAEALLTREALPGFLARFSRMSEKLKGRPDFGKPPRRTLNRRPRQAPKPAPPGLAKPPGPYPRPLKARWTAFHTRPAPRTRPSRVPTLTVNCAACGAKPKPRIRLMNRRRTPLRSGKESVSPVLGDVWTNSQSNRSEQSPTYAQTVRSVLGLGVGKNPHRSSRSSPTRTPVGCSA